MKLRVLITAAAGVFVLAAVTIAVFGIHGAYIIPSESMVPTFEPGDRVFVRDIHGPVNRGDIVIARPPAPVRSGLESLLADLPPEAARQLTPRPQRPFMQIARVVAIGGDHLEVRDGRLHINGAPERDAPYLRPGEPERFFEPIDIPSGHVYLMGDNRNDSRDSRYYGPIPVDDVESVVTFRYRPLGRLGRI